MSMHGDRRRLGVVVLGLSLSSAWGNGHATTYRALLRALADRGHEILFLERDMPWYAASRDLAAPEYCRLAFYEGLADLETRWAGAIKGADAVILGSYVPEGIAVGDLVLGLARGITAFYDIDTPITLAAIARGEATYVAPRQVPRYDLYLSFTGGPTLAHIEGDLGSPAARVLHCAVDAEAYRPVDIRPRWDLSYLGTYSPDRQPTLERLLLEPARRAPELRFAVAGPQYPEDIAWPANVERIEHVPPEAHPGFYGASRFTLNVTRADMLRAGYSPSVRLFEAAACATPILTDAWTGLETVFAPGTEILAASDADEVLAILHDLPEPHRQALGQAGRRRVLAAHTSRHRAAELEAHLLAALARRTADGRVPCAALEATAG